VSKIRLDTDDIKHITLFEGMTGAKVKDLVRIDETMCFLVNAGDMGLAIGKKGVKIDRVRKALGKSVLVMEHDEDPERFIKNMFHPAEVQATNIAKTSGGTTAQVYVNHGDKSRAVGPQGIKIKAIRELAKRHCNIDELTLRTV
jgi:transcription termination/antitermination protein NusA